MDPDFRCPDCGEPECRERVFGDGGPAVIEIDGQLGLGGRVRYLVDRVLIRPADAADERPGSAIVAYVVAAMYEGREFPVCEIVVDQPRYLEAVTVPHGRRLTVRPATNGHAAARTRRTPLTHRLRTG